MAAPATTVRQAPAGKKLKDGFKSLVAFARDPNANFFEKSVGAPGIDGGEPIDQTTMHNTTWRTMALRQLKTLMPFTVRCAYDPDFYTTGGMDNLLNQEGSITRSFSDGTTLDFFGAVTKFEPGDDEEGKQPEGTLTIVPTNWDPVNKVEAGPVLTSVSGT